jgi:hypothetical protein
MIPETLATLETAATAGPWTAEPMGPEAQWQSDNWCVMAGEYRIVENVAEDDAHLIAESRTILPLLIGLWRATRHEIFGVDDAACGIPDDWLYDLEGRA